MSQSSRMELVSGDVGVLSCGTVSGGYQSLTRSRLVLVMSALSPWSCVCDIRVGSLSCTQMSESSPVELVSGDVRALSCGAGCLVMSELSFLELVSGDIRASCGVEVRHRALLWRGGGLVSLLSPLGWSWCSDIISAEGISGCLGAPLPTILWTA